MFTGIVEEIGRVLDIAVDGDRARLTISCSIVREQVAVGESIAVNGCCLTVTDLGRGEGDGWFAADLMAETLSATSLGRLARGGQVNLERAMSASDRFGGHLVQGHVDGVGSVVGRDEQPGTVSLRVRAPATVSRYLVPKGSVTVDGVSLTVVDVDESEEAVFRVGLIPHTLAATSLAGLVEGDDVNLEADVIAKYVERLLRTGGSSPYAEGGG